MLFYGTPILYSAELFPEKARWLLYANPLTELIGAYRDIFMFHKLPEFNGMMYLIGITIFVFGLGYFIFRKLEKGFAEEV